MTADEFNAALDNERLLFKTSGGWFLAQRVSKTLVVGDTWAVDVRPGPFRARRITNEFSDHLKVMGAPQ